MKFTKLIKSSNFMTVKDFISKLQTLDPNKVLQVHGNNGGHTNPRLIELKGGKNYDSYYVIVNEGNTTFETDDIKNFEV